MAKAENPFLPEIARRVTELTDPLGSQDEAAAFLGNPQATLSRIRRGKHDPSGHLLRKLAEKLNVSLNYLMCLSDETTPSFKLGSGRPTPPFEMRSVPKLDARAAAGAGAINHLVAVEEMLAFPNWMLRKLAPPNARLRFMRSTGDSMAPAMRDGALLLVDESQHELPVRPPKPKDEFDYPDVYVFELGGDIRVKRLRLTPKGDILVLSDNRAYDPETIGKRELKDFKIHGRVVWWDNRL